MQNLQTQLVKILKARGRYIRQWKQNVLVNFDLLSFSRSCIML